MGVPPFNNPLAKRTLLMYVDAASKLCGSMAGLACKLPLFLPPGRSVVGGVVVFYYYYYYYGG